MGKKIQIEKLCIKLAKNALGSFFEKYPIKLNKVKTFIPGI